VAQARKLIAESLPHVVLLDWMLPDSSGLVLLSELRRDRARRRCRSSC
jgi:two-component system phosphate regulon response regulator PhoB